MDSLSRVAMGVAIFFDGVRYRRDVDADVLVVLVFTGQVEMKEAGDREEDV